MYTKVIVLLAVTNDIGKIPSPTVVLPTRRTAWPLSSMSVKPEHRFCAHSVEIRGAKER